MNSTQIINQKIKLRNQFKINYDELKELYLIFKIYVDGLKQKGEPISNTDKYHLLFSKSRVAMFAGLYNDDKPLFEKSFKQFKKYGLEFLDALGNSDDVNIRIQNSKFGEANEIYTGTEGEHKNSEAYRQFAIFLKKKTEYFESVVDVWFN
jgi:hypothetical protein